MNVIHVYKGLNDNFNMNIQFSSSKQLSSGSGRRRLFTRTQTSAFRQGHKQYHLANNVYSKQSTLQTFCSNGSQHQHKGKSRVRSVSSNSLFGDFRRKNNSQVKLKLQKRDTFTIPTSSNFQTKTIEDDDVKPNLQKVLQQKLNRKTELKIRQQVQSATMRRIVQEANKKLMKNRIEPTYNLKLEQRKQNLQKSHDMKKFHSMISDYVQTDDNQKDKKKGKDKDLQRKMIKTEVYNIEVPPAIESKQKNIINKKGKDNDVITQNLIQIEIQKIPQLAQVTKMKQVKQTKQIKQAKQVKQVRQAKQIKQVKQVKQIKQLKQPNKNQKIGQKSPKAQVKKTQNTELKNKPKTKYDELDQIEELESVVLTTQSKPPEKKNSATNQVDAKKQNQKKQEKNQADRQKKQLQKQKQLRQNATIQLTQANKIIDMITPMGQVAGYCSQLLKKSQLNWQTPAIILYKDCYQRFKHYEQVYRKAASLGIIDEAEAQRFEEDNKMIEKNLDKVLKMGKKKQRISEQYEKMVLSEKMVNFDPFIQKQVIEFGSAVLCSEEKMNKDVLMCLLRMINGVLIIAKIRGLNVQTLDNIDQIQEDKNLHEVVVQQLVKIQLKKMKL